MALNSDPIRQDGTWRRGLGADFAAIATSWPSTPTMTIGGVDYAPASVTANGDGTSTALWSLTAAQMAAAIPSGVQAVKYVITMGSGDLQRDYFSGVIKERFEGEGRGSFTSSTTLVIGPGSSDADIAAKVANPASAVRAALSSTYAHRPDKMKATGNVIEALYGNGFIFKGVNLGYRNTTGLGRMDTTFVLAYDQAWVHDCIDKIAALGCNVIRIQGAHYAYVLNPATYKANVQEAWTYAHSKGLRVLATLIDTPDNTATTAVIDAPKMAAIKLMMNDMVAGFTDTPMMLWDVANELEDSAVAIELAQHLRTRIGTDQLLTASGTGIGTWITALDPYVDFHDFHFYYPPTTGYLQFGPWVLEQFTARTKKPIIIGEIGTNGATTGNAPHVTDPTQRAAYLSAAVRYVSKGDVCGLIAWKLTSNGSIHDFGLYTAAGAATPQLDAVAAWPARRSDTRPAATVPIVYHNFCRPDSAASVGSASLGGAATVTTGTWGITSKAGRLVTPAGNGSALSLLIWEANSSDVEAAIEFAPPAAGSSTVGIVFRYADASNYYYWRWQRATSSLRLVKVRAGATLDITPANFKAGGSSTGAAISTFAGSETGHIRLAVKATGSLITGSFYDQTFSVWEDASGDAPALVTATKHGILFADSDQGSAVRLFSIAGQARIL